MLTVTLEDIQLRRKVLEARRNYAESASNAARFTTQVTLHTGEMLGLEAGIKILLELEREFFDVDQRGEEKEARSLPPLMHALK